MIKMVGEKPIEFYYPNGFGELNVVPTLSTVGCIDWTVDSNVNNRYAGASAPRVVYENTQIGASRSDCDSPYVRVKAAYRMKLNRNTFGGRNSVSIEPSCPAGGTIKYAYISGKMPSTLTFNIDSGDFGGCIPDLDTFLGVEELGSELPKPRDISPEDLASQEAFGFDFGDQPPRVYDETNYGSGGSGALHSGGFPRGAGIPFVARAFDSSDPYGNYIDGSFVLTVFNNWSSDRDSLIINIRNQMFLDGKPVSNREYLAGRKSQGYFNDCCGCPCED